jgi:hypothetical protein
VAELIRAIGEIPADQLPALMLAIAARMAQVKPAPEPLPQPEPDDINLSIEQAAARLHRSTKWIYRHRATLPFTRKHHVRGPAHDACG